MIAAVVALVVVLMLRNRSANSSVDSFRRHIDALGPEARRNVVDQVQTAAAPTTTSDRRRAADDEPPTTTTGDEDGARGT